jgi:hypothetical protein
MVCNHFALWGIAVALWIAMDVALVMQALVSGEGASEALAFIVQFELVSSVLGALLVGLIFFPPPIYRRWIEGSSPCEA